MSKFNLIVILIAGSFLFACSGTEKGKKTEKDSLTINTNEQEQLQKADSLSLLKQTENELKPTKSSKLKGKKEIRIEELQKGDQISGLTITEAIYEKAYRYKFLFEGEISLNGNLIYNEFEESIDFEVSEEFLPYPKLIIEESNYFLFKYLNFNNINKLKSSLPEEILEQVLSGKSTTVSISVKNLKAEVYLDKGRLEIAYADFVSLN